VNDGPYHRDESSETNPEARSRFRQNTLTVEKQYQKTREHDRDRKSNLPPHHGAPLAEFRYGIHREDRFSMLPRQNGFRSVEGGPPPR
jgi:hypothetical protein